MLLIDSPITPLSSVFAINAWLQELEKMRKQFSDDPEALQAIDEARQEAERFLEMKQKPIA